MWIYIPHPLKLRTYVNLYPTPTKTKNICEYTSHAHEESLMCCSFKDDSLCCSVLQGVAVCCSVLQCVAGCCSLWFTGQGQFSYVSFNVLRPIQRHIREYIYIYIYIGAYFLMCCSHSTHVAWVMWHTHLKDVELIVLDLWAGVGCVDESCQMCGWVMSNVWMSHVKCVDVACHTCDCVM